jgi:hypothetical protein
MTLTRCTECGFPLPAHFRRNGPNEGALIGCPPRVLLSDADAHLAPRLIARIGHRGALKGRLLVFWADCVLPADPTADKGYGQILMWDLDSGDQDWRPRDWMQQKTRRLPREQMRDLQDRIEYELGQRVRMVLQC